MHECNCVIEIDVDESSSSENTQSWSSVHIILEQYMILAAHRMQNASPPLPLYKSGFSI